MKSLLLIMITLLISGCEFTGHIGHEIKSRDASDKSFVLAWESETLNLGGDEIIVRIKDSLYKFWPGGNPQVVVLVKNGNVVKTQKIGGEPMFLSSDIVQKEDRLLLLAACKLRRDRDKIGVFFYEINQDLNINYLGSIKILNKDYSPNKLYEITKNSF